MPRQRSTTQDDVLRRLRARDRDTDPVMSPNEIAAGMEASRPTISNRLHEMSEDGMVKHREVGQATVWWPADERMTEGDELEAVKEKMSRRISELEAEKETLSDERDHMQQYATAGALVTIGVLLGYVGLTFPSMSIISGSSLVATVSSYITIAGAFSMVVGCVHWFLTAIRPTAGPWFKTALRKVTSSVTKGTPAET